MSANPSGEIAIEQEIIVHLYILLPQNTSIFIELFGRTFYLGHTPFWLLMLQVNGGTSQWRTFLFKKNRAFFVNQWALTTANAHSSCNAREEQTRAFRQEISAFLSIYAILKRLLSTRTVLHIFAAARIVNSELERLQERKKKGTRTEQILERPIRNFASRLRT